MTAIRASRAELEAILAEDTPHGDLTTEALGIAARPGVMCFSARDPQVVAGIEIARELIELCGGRVETFATDGDLVAPGAELLRAEGPAEALHRAWKSAQTTMELLGGIAGAAREVVEAATVEGRRVPVACTRKTFPGVRRLQAAAIRAGGAIVHRAGLSETILVFAEHRAFLGDEPLSALVERLRAGAPEKKLVIEVATPDEAAAAAEAGFDVIQLEKFTPAAVAETAERVKPHRPAVVLASAGGISPVNAGAHVAAGADLLVTSWPYGARPRDVQVSLRPR
jgi:molybdenum transport protein